MTRSLLHAALWTGLLILGNLLVYLAGPKLEQLSGNGLPPAEAVALLLALGSAIGWLEAIRRFAGEWAVRLAGERRYLVAVVALAAGAGLALWAFATLSSLQERFHALHPGRTMPEAYRLTYLAITWQFWAGLGALPAAIGLWAGERRSGASR